MALEFNDVYEMLEDGDYMRRIDWPEKKFIFFVWAYDYGDGKYIAQYEDGVITKWSPVQDDILDPFWSRCGHGNSSEWYTRELYDKVEALRGTDLLKTIGEKNETTN